MRSVKTIPAALVEKAHQTPTSPAYKRKENGQWQTYTWKSYFENVKNLAAGLQSLGVKKGDRVALLSVSRSEWALSDIAILSLGAVTVPIYPSNTSEDVQYVLTDSEAKVVIVENETQFEKIKNFKSLEHIVSIEKLPHSKVISLDELGKRGKTLPFDLEKEIENVSPGDMATLVYTSGTTGKPKGAILTHGNLVSEVADIEDAFPVSSSDVFLSFLPFAHILARVEHLGSVYVGWCLAYAESIEKVSQNLGEVKPTALISVPRIYEKAFNKIMTRVEGSSPLQKKIFYWALHVGHQVSVLLEKKQGVPLLLELQYKLASKLVFNKIKQNFGGRIRFLISGGAPLSQDIARFFHAAGLLILEGYGLTETTAAVTGNRLDNFRFGTVGLPLSDVEIKIEREPGYPPGEGEIFVKSSKVFKGYFKREADTRAVLNGDWLATGDIGRIEDGGFLKITDRKKDIIVTSAGKNIAPQNIENFLKTDPHISQVMVYGDKRHYLTALITLNQDEVLKYAKTHQVSYQNWADLVSKKEVEDLVKTVVEGKNKTLASYETIKKFKILPQDFSIESGELTPTLKVKRKFCTEKYKSVLETMYN